jgi:hypothetical protein
MGYASLNRFDNALLTRREGEALSDLRANWYYFVYQQVGARGGYPVSRVARQQHCLSPLPIRPRSSALIISLTRDPALTYFNKQQRRSSTMVESGCGKSKARKFPMYYKPRNWSRRVFSFYLLKVFSEMPKAPSLAKRDLVIYAVYTFHQFVIERYNFNDYSTLARTPNIFLDS